MSAKLKHAFLLLGFIVFLGDACDAFAANQTVLKYKAQTGLTITGSVGTVYAVLYTTNLTQSSAWRCLKFLQMPATSYLMPGTAATNKGCRLYRVAAMTPTNLVFIPSGSFTMGSPTNEVGRFSDEGPQTTVTIGQGFWIAKNLVTQQEYQSVMGSNPSFYTGDPALPVEQVSWMDATNYCAQRTVQDRVAGRIPAGCFYRLPTEAEWEYACRAGTTTRFSYGDDPGYTNLANHAWYSVNSTSTHVVGQKPANAWGLFDMHGNVLEWCQDWYDAYPGGTVTDPQGPATGDYRVLRGGSWAVPASLCRSACRFDDDSAAAYNEYGFRVVLVASGP
jgi:formylglycine-generating enzyme required for sulfatase activity